MSTGEHPRRRLCDIDIIHSSEPRPVDGEQLTPKAIEFPIVVPLRLALTSIMLFLQCCQPSLNRPPVFMTNRMSKTSISCRSINFASDNRDELINSRENVSGIDGAVGVEWCRVGGMPWATLAEGTARIYDRSHLVMRASVPFSEGREKSRQLVANGGKILMIRALSLNEGFLACPKRKE